MIKIFTIVFTFFLLACTPSKKTTKNLQMRTMAPIPLSNQELTEQLRLVQDELAAMKSVFKTDSLVVTSGIHVGRPIKKTNTQLIGDGTSVTGFIVAYYWRQVKGPTRAVIESGNTAYTLVNNLTYGVYEFELTVTDNSGLTGMDTIEVTVVTDTSAIFNKQEAKPIIYQKS